MQLNRVEIPGKAMLFGEYAVLVGGTAVMSPVPRYLVLTERNDSPKDAYTLVIEAARTLAIPELVSFEAESGRVNLDCDNSRFFVRDRDGVPCKLGLGLSAAEAVGVIALRFQRTGYNVETCRDRIAQYARQAHRLAQNNRGSGADVYCCAYRTPLKYNIKNGQPRIEHVTFKHASDKMPMHLVYTGKSSDSRRAIDKFNLWCQSMTAGDRQQLRHLVQISDTLAEDWNGIPDENIFKNLDEFIMEMKSISDKAGLQYWNDIHTDLDGWARKHGGRAKPVGAGGGDMVLVLGHVPIEEIWPQSYDYCFEIPSAMPEKSGYQADEKNTLKNR